MRRAPFKLVGVAILVVLGFLSSTFPSLLFVAVCSVFSPEGQTYMDACMNESFLRPASMAARVVGFVVLIGGIVWLWKQSDTGGTYSKVVAGGLLSLFGAVILFNFTYTMWSVWSGRVGIRWRNEFEPFYTVLIVGIAFAIMVLGGRMLLNVARSWKTAGG